MATHDHEKLAGPMMLKAFSLKGLPYVRAVQKVYVGTQYLYVLQMYKGSQIISRCPMRPFAEVAQTVTVQDHMTLTNFGHGQTLDWYSHNGKDYFLVTTKPNEREWSTQVGRIQYKAGATINGNTDITRLSSINRAQKSGASIGTLVRTEAAVSTSGKEILILAIADNGAGKNAKSVFTRYKLKELNDLWDKYEKKNISAGDEAVKRTAIDTLTINGSLYSKTMNHSIQGLDLSDGAAIYISSGAQGTQPAISKSYWSSNTINKGKYVDSRYWPISKGLVETEGLQLKGKYLFLTLAMHSNPDGHPDNHVAENLVYYVNKDVFG